MGFGILICGYTLLLSISLHSMGVYAELLGYLLMLRALSLLGQYQNYFTYARRTIFALIPVSAYALSEQCLSWFGFDALYSRLHSVTELPYSILLAVLLLVFHMFLLIAVKKLAEEVDLPKLRTEAMRNMIVTWLYFAATIAVSFLNIPAVTDVVPYHNLVSYVSLFGILWMLLNAKMIFVCYMRICLPGDEDMPVGDRKMPRLFGKQKEMTPEEQEAAERAAKQRQKAEYDNEMKQRQLERTKKNKRRKHR